MQIAVITDEIDDNLDHALHVMAEYGIRHAEIRVVDGKNISVMSNEEIDDVKRALNRHGAQAICIASPFYKTDLPGAGEGIAGPLHGARSISYDEQIALLQRCIEIAKKLDTAFIRTFTFWKHGLLTPEIEDRIVAAYVEPAMIAEDAGMTLLVENEHACYTGTGAETARIVSRIDSTAVRIVWDPGNAVCAGETAFPAGYEAVKPFMDHVHVKDAIISDTGEMEWVAVGEGIVGWPAQIAALKADGYHGFLSMETHYNGLKNKELSTRQCLENLKNILGKT